MTYLRLLFLLLSTNLSVLAQTYQVTPVLSTQRFYLNGGNRAFIGGKSRVIVPITLPVNTVEWYYTISAYATQQGADQARQSYNLFTSLVSTLDQVGIVALSARLMQPTGAEVCDVFLLPSQEAASFVQKTSFRSFPIASRENFNSGVVPVKQASLQRGTYYLGLRNPSAMSGIHINLEVHAVVLTTEDTSDPAISLTNPSTVAVDYQYSEDGQAWHEQVLQPNYYCTLPATGPKGTLLIRLNSVCQGVVSYRLDASNRYKFHYAQGCWEVTML